MTTKRAELINALIRGLKIDEDIYAIETVKEKTEFLNESQYLDFYQSVMDEDAFGNGVKAVINVAERFKPQIIEVDELEIKAKELIDLVRAMNDAIYRDHAKTGIAFDNLLNGVKFPNVSADDIVILNNVRPHYNLKLLIGGINTYQTSIDALNAFKNAITNNHLAIENSSVSKMIRGLK